MVMNNNNWQLTRREFVGLCSKSILILAGIGISGCIGIDDKEKDNKTSQEMGDINKLKDMTQGNHGIKFIIIGDPHAKSNGDTNRGNERLEQIVGFINKQDVDFSVFLGDMADDGTNKTNKMVKLILNKMEKQYYVIAGNHDILESPDIFEANYGLMKHIDIVEGYQLLFIGIYDEIVNGKRILHWSFDFNKANKNLPTLVFIHGPTINPPSICNRCKWGKNFFGYGQSMKPELDKFTNLIGVYGGHVHYNSDQTINGVRHITINGLIHTKNTGGLDASPSDEIGYSIIQGNKIDYKLLTYR